MNSETADLLRSSLGNLLAEVAGRDILHRLAELGWHEVAADDPEEAMRLLFEAQGRALVSSPALDMVILTAMRPFPPGVGDPLDATHAMLHPHPENRQTTSGVLRPSPHDLPDRALTAPGLVEICGVTLSGFGATAQLVVPVAAGGSVALFVLERPTEHLEARPIDGMAPELELMQVRGTVEATQGELFPLAGTSARWGEAVAAARRALAHELTGITAVMLDLAIGHATDRVQFGRPIGRFQAIQHRLADCHVALDAARTAATQSGESRDELASSAAKALAGNAFRIAARHCQQVFGAIGFTWEHPFHFAMRRGMVLELLYGSAPSIQEELGRAIRKSDQPFRHLVSL